MEIRAYAFGPAVGGRCRRIGFDRKNRIAPETNGQESTAPVVNSHFQFQYPWVLALLALLPVYAFLRGRIGKFSALRFPSADIARAAGAAARSAAGRLLVFLRILTLG